MKKIVLVVLLSAGFSQLKAQQLLQLKPGVKLSDSLYNSFKPHAYVSPQTLLAQPKAGNQLNNSGLKSADGEIFYSRMPVLKTHSTDNMPIAKLGRSGMKYTMLVKKITVVDPLAPAATAIP